MSDLTPSQQKALDLCLAGGNVFITGPGGVGKSHLIRRIISLMRVTPTSTTVISAANIGGESLHSTLGLGLGVETAERCVAKMSKFRRAAVSTIRTLLIDEISMASPDLLDLCDQVLRLIFGSEKPFGGLQVIVVGDFFQLPPVEPGVKKARYAFQSPIWEALEFTTVKLTENMRQEDAGFFELLNGVRTGDLEEGMVDRLLDLIRPESELPEAHTVLHATNADVDQHNRRYLASLPGEEVTFEATDFGLDFKLKGCRLPKELGLKRDAIAMFLVNSKPLFNGCIGTIEDIHEEEVVFKPTSPSFEGKVFSVRTTTQKIYQGHERIQVPKDTIPQGQYWYSPSLDGIFTKTEIDLGTATRPKVVASRTAMPLRLAKAMSIHKSQGSSIDALYAKVSRCFAPGHFYTAISRARSEEGLALSDIKKWEVSDEVKKFYEHI